MTDLISKADRKGLCYIITIENPDNNEKQLISHAKDIIDYNRKVGNIINEKVYPTINNNMRDSLAESTKVIEVATDILKRNKLNKEIAECMKTQILSELEAKKDPYSILIYAAEAISRLGGGGDVFTGEVKEKIDIIKKELKNENA